MLEELKTILEMFEFVTDEFQTNKVSISRVYPCIKYLQENLCFNLSNFRYTKQLRKDLLESLNTRFETLIENDVFIVSTFLDPNFCLDSFETDKKTICKKAH